VSASTELYRKLHCPASQAVAHNLFVARCRPSTCGPAQRAGRPDEREERLRLIAPHSPRQTDRHGVARGGVLATLPVWLSGALACGMLRSRNALTPLLSQPVPFPLFITEQTARAPAG